jgi:hypothetical protein
MPTGSSLTDEELRARAREQLEAGRLPCAISTYVNAAYGGGRRCALCEERIERTHIEYEIADLRHSGSTFFHLRCHHAWQLECLCRMPPPPRPNDRGHGPGSRCEGLTLSAAGEMGRDGLEPSTSGLKVRCSTD